MTLEMEEFWKKLIIGVGIIFLPFSWREVQFSFFGSTARATVMETRDLRGRGKAVDVEYEFADSTGKQRKAEDCMPAGTAKPAVGEKIEIQYCAGLIDASRVAGNSDMFLVYLFLGMIFGGVTVGQLIGPRAVINCPPIAVPWQTI